MKKALVMSLVPKNRKNKTKTTMEKLRFIPAY